MSTRAVVRCCLATLMALGLGALAVAPGSGAAPSPDAPGPGGTTTVAPAFSALNVDIWPEHDDPRLLVIYRGTLNAVAPLPYRLTFAIPPGGQVNAAAHRSADGQLWTVPHEYRQEGRQLQVSMTIPERGFQFEYYVDAIKGLPDRSFAVDLLFPLPAASLRVSVEQPLRASSFTLVPRAGGATTTGGGFTHHVYEVGPWPAGRPWSVRATYRKLDSNPSVPRAVAVPPPAPPAVPAGGLPAWLWGVVAAGALGAVGLAAVGVRRLRAQRRRSRTPAPAQRAAQFSRRAAKQRDGGERVYCSQCGARARPGDRFCSRCGQPLAGEP